MPSSLTHVALLLPLTSRGRSDQPHEGSPAQLRARVSTLIRSLHVSQQAAKLHLFVGLDRDDEFYAGGSDETSEDASPGWLMLQEVIKEDAPEMVLHRRIFDLPPGRICALWKGLATQAHKEVEECSYFFLVGDDVELHTPDWFAQIHSAFVEQHARLNSVQADAFPFGFGCISFNDLACPRFPTFPVLHRTHFDIFPEVFPDAFVNQDADPFLFEIYRRWNASHILDHVQLTNGIGGHGEARYEKQHLDRWSYELLTESVEHANDFLRERAARIPDRTFIDHRFTLIDVVVPCYRCDIPSLDRIVGITVPERTLTQFLIIVDQPTHPNVDEICERFQRPRSYVRVQDTNSGASAARNRGIRDSRADWILFLDDDVSPSPNILVNYVRKLRADSDNPTRVGFIGRTEFPSPSRGNLFTTASRLMDIDFLWNQPVEEPRWCVTASLVTRRKFLFFDETFIKTGGGEDIDYCLRIARHEKGGGTFGVAHDAEAAHPWWRDGGRVYGHFAGWAHGDGRLIDLYPELTFRSSLNIIEMCLLWLALAAMRPLALYLLPTVGALLPSGAQTLLLLLWTLLVEFAFQAYGAVTSRHRDSLSLSALDALACVPDMVANKVALECGRIQGHFDRHGVACLWRHFGRRFDWFCAAVGSEWFVPGEKRQEARKFAAFVALPLLYTISRMM